MLLLDTHAVIWATADDPRLGRQARALLAGVSVGSAAISHISLLEIAMLLDKRRIRTTVPGQDYLARVQASFRVLPICATVAFESMRLELPQGDPFDRVVVATAMVHRLTLLTRDRKIRTSGLVPVVW